MKKIVFLYITISLIFIRLCHAQNIKIKGDILFYYTIIAQSAESPSDAVVTLDSVRIHSNGIIFPVLAETFQREVFYKDSTRYFMTLDIITTIRKVEQYRDQNKNILYDNFCHKGGDVYNLRDNDSILVKGFSFKGDSYYVVIPDSLKFEKWREYRTDDDEIPEGIYIPTIYSKKSFVFLKKIESAKSFSKIKMSNYNLSKSNITDIYIYGL